LRAPHAVSGADPVQGIVKNVAVWAQRTGSR